MNEFDLAAHNLKPPGCEETQTRFRVGEMHVNINGNQIGRLLAMGLLLAALLQPSSVLGQEKTLVSGGIESGGFGGPVVKFSGVTDEFAVFVGGRGGWIINSTFVIGGGGYGLTNDIRFPIGQDDAPHRRLEFGYGGGELEFVAMSDEVVHFTGLVLVGGGGLTFDRYDDAVFVLEPSANLELNIVRWCRLNIGAGYRFVSGVDLPGFSNSDFSAFFGQVTAKFGKF